MRYIAQQVKITTTIVLTSITVLLNLGGGGGGWGGITHRTWDKSHLYCDLEDVKLSGNVVVEVLGVNLLTPLTLNLKELNRQENNKRE